MTVVATHPDGSRSENYLEGAVLDAEAGATGMSVVITTAGQPALGSHHGPHYQRRVRPRQRRDSPPKASRQSAGYRRSGVEWRNLDDIADVFTSSRGFALLRKNELSP
jgi:hypothetical protein